ncbi:MAG: DUF11 domain-containing protein, partial [Chloroflexi bacterium]|nr:DUF11 domain-containing protein [Chloroflexota bacterium]
MTRRTRRIPMAIAVVALMLFGAVLVQAATITLNNADGVWANAAGSPTCLRWNNTAPTTDENQVAYGYRDSCPGSLDLSRQSGFGFNGTNGPLAVETGVPFLLGQLTHYNRPIYTGNNPFTTVDLNVTLQFDGHPDKTLSFQMDLDETTNSYPCPYTPNDEPCADRVQFNTTVGKQVWQIEGTWYTLEILGFVPGTAGTCVYSSSTINQFITQEEQRNDACLFAMLVEAKMTLVKSGAWVDGNGNGYADAGETINYTFVVTNEGEETLSSITVTDPKVGPVTCPETELDAGESMTCTGSYAVTQDDIDAGSVYNLATATGETPGGGDVEVQDEVTVPLAPNPKMTLEKTGTFDAGADGYAQPGELITYEFLVKNTGNVKLTDITVTDPLPELSTINCPDIMLPAGQEMTCTATYAVTQDDIDDGSVYNLATADSNETEPVTDPETVPLPNPVLTLDKSVTETGYANVDDILHYSYELTNS